MPARHVANGRAARALGPQVPQVGGQVLALDHRHGVLDGLERRGAVVLGGDGAQPEVAVAAVRVRRVQRDQVGQPALDHLHAVPGVLARHAVQVGLDLARGERVLHLAALVLLVVGDAAPADDAQRALVQLQDLVAVLFG